MVPKSDMDQLALAAPAHPARSENKATRPLFIDAESVSGVREQIEHALNIFGSLKGSNIPGFKWNASLMITSTALNCVVDGNLDGLFGQLALACKHVVARKLGRSQKAKILEIIRNLEKASVTVKQLSKPRASTLKAHVKSPKSRTKFPKPSAVSLPQSISPKPKLSPKSSHEDSEHLKRSRSCSMSVHSHSSTEFTSPRKRRNTLPDIMFVDHRIEYSKFSGVRKQISVPPVVITPLPVSPTAELQLHSSSLRSEIRVSSMSRQSENRRRLSVSVEFFLSAISPPTSNSSKHKSLPAPRPSVRPPTQPAVVPAKPEKIEAPSLVERIASASVIPPEGPIDRRSQIIMEVLRTEHAYVQKLHELEAIFLEPLSGPLVASKNNKNVVGVVTMVKRLHDLLLRSMLDAIETGTDIAQVFCDFARYFKLYAQYARMYDLISGKIVCVLNSDIPEGQEAERGGNTLLSLLIQPIQRLPRYVLLLKELQKYTPYASHPVLHGLARCASELMADQCAGLNAASAKWKKWRVKVVSKAQKKLTKHLKAARREGSVLYCDDIEATRIADEEYFRKMKIYVLKEDILWTDERSNVIASAKLSDISLNKNWNFDDYSIEMTDESNEFSIIMDFTEAADLRVFQTCFHKLKNAGQSN
eukprot:178937_1